jgi:hypothetical protein
MHLSTFILEPEARKRLCFSWLFSF